jgi:hypothetical protein
MMNILFYPVSAKFAIRYIPETSILPETTVIFTSSAAGMWDCSVFDFGAMKVTMLEVHPN